MTKRIFGRIGRGFFAAAAATVVILGLALPFTSGIASATSSVVLSHCHNGSLASPVACNNTTSQPLGYGNGDLVASGSHYREGDFVPYTAALSGLGAGANSLEIGYRVVDSGAHSLDYLGSFDTSEQTSPTPGTHFVGNNNPCDGLTLASPCTPATPTAQFPVPGANFAGANATNCGSGTKGTFAGTQAAGDIKLYGAPSGSTINNVTYAGENQPSASGCVTNVLISLNLSAALTSGQSIVLAWGGHIASQLDWGAGNSASFGSGSSYHMFLDALNGSNIGSQDHQMKTSAVFFTPSASTTIINDTANLPLSGTINIGQTVHDTATLQGASPAAAGTMTFTLRNDTGTSACSGTTISTDPVTFSAEQANSPNSVGSAPFTPTSAGSYSYQAVFAPSDSSDVPGNFTSACEPFTVLGNTPALATTAQFSTDNTTFSNVGGTLAIGNWVRDTSSLTGAATPIAGSATYTLYSGTSCAGNTPSGTPQFSNSQTVSSATPPPSTSFQVPTAGTYQWQAVFTSSNNQNTTATSPCGSETFTVGPNSPTLSTQAQSSPDNTTFTQVTGPVAISSWQRDTASLSGAATPTTGDVVYSLYTGTNCTGNTPGGTVQFTDTENLSNNAIPPSAATQLLTAGTYQWQAVYTSGNGQNNGATSPCGSETFTVAPNSPTLSTQAQSSPDNTTFANVTGTVTIGTFVRDTASLNGAATPTAGQVVYTLYTGSSCSFGAPTGTVKFTDTENLAANEIPPSAATQLLTAGTYQWQADYTSSNGQNLGAMSPCGSEIFTVGPHAPTLSTQAQSSSDNVTFANIAGAVPIGTFGRDTASLSGAAAPTTGKVVYTLYAGTSCTGNTPGGTVQFTDTENLSNNAVPPSAAMQLSTAGTYQWQAVYTSGNGQNNDATSTCGSETFTVGPNNPTLNTQAQSSSDNLTFTDVTGPVAIGSFVRDSAMLNDAAKPITGHVVYTLYNGTSCTGNTPGGTVQFTDTETLAGNAIPPSLSTLLTSAGAYQWQAVYTSGNGQNSDAISACGSETFTVAPNSPTLSTQAQSSSDNVTFANITGTVAIGTFVRDSASLTGAATPTTGKVVYTLYTGNGCNGNTPSGTVQFTDTENLAANAIPLSDSTPLTTSGDYQWQAVYTSGNGQNNNATAPCGSETFTVAPNSPLLSTQAQSSSDNVTFTNITGPVAIGSFERDTATLDGAATPTTGKVVYTLYAGTSCTGNTPSGTVEFTSSVNLATNAIPTSASWQLLTAGDYQWQAVYTSGNGQNDDATSPCGTETFTVSPNSPALSTQVQSSSDNTTFMNSDVKVAIGSFVRDTASLSNAATPTTGQVVYTLYNGTGCSANTPTGTIQFTDTENLAANAIPPSASTSLTTAGDYQWQAVYTSGNGQNTNAASACGSESFTVSPNSPTLGTTAQSSADNTTFSDATRPIALNSFVRDTAALTAAATPTTGQVVYTLYSGTGCTANSPSGTSLFTDTETLANNAIPDSSPFQLTSAGDYQWQAVYTSGNGQNDDATSPCGSETFSVAKAATSTATVLFDATTNATWTNTETTGATAYDTSKLSGIVTGIVPTGTVTYSYITNGNSTAPSSSTQAVTLTSTGTVPHSATTAALAAGSDSFDAVYNGDSNYEASAVSPCEPFTVAAVVTPPAGAPAGAKADPPAPTTTPNPPVTRPSSPVTQPAFLAFTGANIAAMVVGGLVLLGTGTFLVMMTRRRRRTGDEG